MAAWVIPASLTSFNVGAYMALRMHHTNSGGGLHNYGLAVDISIQDSLGQPLPMGTKVDHLGMEAHITDEIGLVHNGKMSETERQNRLLLRKVMKETGFRALPSEWWHFNFCSRDVAKQKYKLIP
jgi:zinc D-Ala-D-Ala dipeptidase